MKYDGIDSIGSSGGYIGNCVIPFFKEESKAGFYLRLVQL